MVLRIVPDDVLCFWLEETPSDHWFRTDQALDAAIRHRFQGAWEEGRIGALDGWAETADGTLALILLFDQFPRNMFRGRAEAFATDAKAQGLAKAGIIRGDDSRVANEGRAFFYMPLMHAENLADQELCVRLIRERLGENSQNYPFALRHRDIIVRFGRFPARNAALGREPTPEEIAFLAKNPLGF